MLYLFDDCTIDASRREVRRADKSIPVEPKVLDLVLYLLANRDRLVSKDELVSAVWNGRIVSDSAISACIHSARVALGDAGAGQRLIKTFPRKGLRFIGKVRDTPSPSIPPTSVPALALPDRPSVAVLPFVAEPDQSYFADGVVDEVILALSRMRWLFVIARNSSFTYRDRVVDVRQIGRELGVRYVIEGSVRKSSNRVRITAQLIDAESRLTLAGHRCDGVLGDIFELQDTIVSEMIAVIAPKLEANEINRTRRKPTENLDAYDLYLRGLESYYLWTQPAHELALSFFKQAFALDDNFAAACGMAARCYTSRKVNGWMVDREAEVSEARRLSRQAVALGGDDAVALTAAGFTNAHVLSEKAAGRALVERALRLNPNYSVAWYCAGWIDVWLEDAASALEKFGYAMRYSPIDPLMFNFHAGIASAHFVAGRLDDARLYAMKAIDGRPSFVTALQIAAATSALGGRLAEAREHVAALRRINGDLRVGNAADRFSLHPNTLSKLMEGLRLAGMPE
ncbi:winged helix-turn-helix domain-containing tetratricopeptide repeat protein [Bradyrhizobium sp. WSM1743]|uniref:winged helix-turn-helix domain-containing tetratricopeptide repeat protein n=1 Tax=Bradyrhizobium sp. WSM1743 TaxID=318996 RepID=UPI000412C5BE|nr:winged helix-turn-helix domain-containing tetratricopeptide repeat protein [Bradyrhizobium sp. WSM1743]